MDLRKWLKRGKKSPDPGTPQGAPELDARGRPPMPPLPRWAKQDAFIRKEGEKAESGPSDMAEMASIKRPGKWLKSKLGIREASEKLQHLTQTEEGRDKGAPDQDLREFLDGFLEPEAAPKTEEKAVVPPSKPQAGKPE